MNKKLKISLIMIVSVFIICCLAWWFLPVHFLRGIVPEEIAAIEVLNWNNGDKFMLTDPEDISYIVSGIKRITFRKEFIASDFDDYYCWYYLTFMDEHGEEVDSLRIQNARYVREDITRKQELFYRCGGELGEVADYLESLEAAWFPDYRKDPDL